MTQPPRFSPPGGPASDLFALELRRPLLVASFEEPQRVLSFAPARPGFQRADRVAWLAVRNADLAPHVDPLALLQAKLGEHGLLGAVAMMTSRDVGRVRRADARIGAVAADCAATTGLSNAVRVQAPASVPPQTLGTINILAAVSAPLTDAGLIEALSIAAEARTAAVIDAGWRIDGGMATGTGTDCVAVAAPEGPDPSPYAGLHTEIGQAIGAAVYDAVLAGARDWIAERG